MKKYTRLFLSISLLTIGFASSAAAQQVKRSPFDVQNYKIDATLNPAENRLTATSDVTFVPQEETRTVTFELNGSLKIDTVTRIGDGAAPVKPKNATAPQTQGSVTFVQDQVGVSDIGPNVRVDLGGDAPANVPITLRFVYSGILNTPNGGPLLNKKLASVGDNEGYLMYAARWFPFHNYAADLATSDITLNLPGGFQVAGFSELPVTPTGGKYRFVRTKPALVGTFAYGRYIPKTVRVGQYEISFYTRTGNDELIQNYGEVVGKALEYYTKQFGTPDMGTRLIVAEIDDESLDFYSAPGVLLIGSRQFAESREVTSERLEREAALQWWGMTVGLKTFDDAWLSQGLAAYSAFELRESTMSGAKLYDLRRELLEKSLTFEQTTSLLRAPANLDDQSTAYKYIMFAKGAFVYKLLRDTMGEQKFAQLLRTFLQKYRNKNASIYDFEQLATEIDGENLRYFFARWVEGTGVPEFTADYVILRTREGKFIARGTVKQNYDNLKLPVDVQLRSEGDAGLKTATIEMNDTSADFNIESTGMPLSVVIDPNYKLLRISPDLRVSSIARRGIEQFKEGNYVEAQQQFEAALKLDRSNSWIYYHLGLLYLEQRNYDLAVDNFKATLGGNLSPQWLAVWANIKMGNAYDAKGDRVRASAAYKRAEDLGDTYDGAQEAVKKYQANPYDPRQEKVTASN